MPTENKGLTSEYSGGGDPRRSIELLWGVTEPRGRGPKPKLTVPAVVEAAIGIADANGLATVSMRRVAEELGVGAMSLYTYVPSKSELIDLMIDKVYAELLEPDREGGWRVRVEQVARAHWELFHRHPWLVEISGFLPVIGPNACAKYERDLRTVDGIGLTDLEMDAVISVLLAHVEGLARRAFEGEAIQRRTGQSAAEWWYARAPILEEVVPAGAFPVGGRVGAATGEAFNAASDPAYHFEFGLARLLDGVQVLIDSRH